MKIPIAFLVVILLASNHGAEGTIGMNWGRQTAQRLVPSQVVDLLLQNGIGNAKVYTSEIDIMKAFSGSGINLTIGINNRLLFTSLDGARSWVQWKQNYFVAANVRGVVIGDQVFFKGITDRALLYRAIDCLQFVQTALNEVGLSEMKANFQHFIALLKQNSTKPSEAEFRDEIKVDMIRAVRFLQENNAPFLLEMFPIFDTTWKGFDPSFAFPDNKSTQVVTDVNGAVYTNMFEFTYDSFVWALEKINASDMKIIVSHVGWPTDGYPGANATAAERFFKGLLPLVTSTKGTPKRPGAPIDIFVRSLTDENQLDYDHLPFMRHWGIYRSNGQPKYKIDLSGQGRDIYPTMVKGIMRMPQRWCVFNGNKTDLERVGAQFEEACKKADCTSIAPGGSCSQLNFDKNVSYAFNMHFQFLYQDEEACDFGGLASVSVDDPSTDDCVFPVEVVKGQQVNFIRSAGEGFHERPNIFAILVFMLGILILDLQ